MFKIGKIEHYINEVIRLNFVNEEHKNFYIDKLNKYGNLDSYYRSIIYTLGICNETRKYFNEIFDINRGINIDSIQYEWQTGTSQKVTRMAFNLFNGCVYDSEKERERGEKSENYNPSELFCCSYAPYFYEAIKIRYPEYTRNINIDIDIPKDYVIEENEKVEIDNDSAALYIRAHDIYMAEKQKEQLLKYCRDNNIYNKTIYTDIGYSGNDADRPSLKKMEEDLKNKKVNKIIFTNPSKLYRDVISFYEFEERCKKLNIELISIDMSLEMKNTINENLLNKIQNDIDEFEMNEKDNI